MASRPQPILVAAKNQSLTDDVLKALHSLDHQCPILVIAEADELWRYLQATETRACCWPAAIVLDMKDPMGRGQEMWTRVQRNAITQIPIVAVSDDATGLTSGDASGERMKTFLADALRLVLSSARAVP